MEITSKSPLDNGPSMYNKMTNRSNNGSNESLFVTTAPMQHLQVFQESHIYS